MGYERIKNFILDTLFPPHCVNCGKEGSYLCEDCQSLIEILENLYCPVCKKRLPILNYTISDLPFQIFRRKTWKGTCKECKNRTKLNGLYFAAAYQNQIVKKLISQFKYGPLIKELANPLSNLIITHFQLLAQHLFSKGAGLNQVPYQNSEKSSTKNLVGGHEAGRFGAEFLLVPVPLHKKKLKQRGFNQAEEIAKKLSEALKISLVTDLLIKVKETLPQVGLSMEERKENLKGVFWIKNESEIKNRKILLVDDVYTTGSTMEECAEVLKKAGAKEVWGVAVARE